MNPADSAAVPVAAKRTDSVMRYDNHSNSLRRRLLLKILEEREMPSAVGFLTDTGHNFEFNHCAAATAVVGTGVVGEPVVLTATVHASANVTGTVKFFAGDKLLGTLPITNGSATMATTELPAGRSQMTAEFNSDRALYTSRDVTVIRLAEPSADSKFISSVLADVAAEYHIPGLSAAVVVGNKVVTGAAGVREAGVEAPVPVGDSFHLGSTTKAMTATLTGVLVEKGLLRWDSTVAEIFPELKGKIVPQYEIATLQQLLSHTAGVINDSDVVTDPAAYPGLPERYAGYAGAVPNTARADFLPLLLSQTPTNAVGEFHYSNFGYSVVGAALERRTGLSYEAMMQKYVFGPLGMNTAKFTDAFAPQRGVIRQPVGHNAEDGKPVSTSDPFFQLNAISIQNPAGSNLAMSAGDWGKFIRFQLGQTVNQPAARPRRERQADPGDAP